MLPDPTWGTSPYDVNFAFPVLPDIMENEKIRLTPFIPRLHAEMYWKEADPSIHPQLYDHLPWNWQKIDDFLSLVERIRLDPMWILFAIIDKTGPGDLQGGSLAGIIGVIRAEPHNLVAEIGAILVFPAFQRSHVAKNAIGLCMMYCLELPTASPAGLGLRRVKWTTSPANLASAKAAEGMGMKLEGRNRWARIYPAGTAGTQLRPGDPRPGIEMLSYAICWDDWEEGGRDRVKEKMDRI
ncbi:acyl-CoA N-acyltransferase [Gloeophyllum trabeum ATCC 11539]|uniref:Acyl-CoA N-acyltransferase n=1 Tax=Gloeophyllum trabeum (strain ATCC 11539 / FP-39264 / Madison 617) TaxID=670483 RepID=S7Q3H7_GLOTA|nr:acyl-CoA N-acyltransferase [Gloeophyllum trabeum ATCC 11539]EPQ54107.1 acyl-CoA N-acyltransferase [Gloeophyllum trabeum ATCC 11539]